MIQPLVRGHGDERDEKVLDHVRLPDCIPDISSGDADVALRLEGIIKKDAISDDLGLAFGKVAPASATDEWSAISGRGGDEEGEYDSGEDGDEPFDWGESDSTTTTKKKQAT